MTTLECSRCGQTGQALEEVPIPGEIGERIRRGICTDCYQAWRRESARFLQDNGLRLTEAPDRARLLERLKAFMGFDAQPTASSVAGPAPAPQRGSPGPCVTGEALPRLPEAGPRPYWPF